MIWGNEDLTKNGTIQAGSTTLMCELPSLKAGSLSQLRLWALKTRTWLESNRDFGTIADTSGKFMRLTAAIWILSLVLSTAATADMNSQLVIKTIIGEAADQGQTGMQAVAEVIRRRGSMKPFVASRRKDLDKFVRNQGRSIWQQAETAWKRSEKSNLTKNATHYENLKSFGLPSWAKSSSMRKTVKIGDHQFYREVRS